MESVEVWHHFMQDFGQHVHVVVESGGQLLVFEAFNVTPELPLGAVYAQQSNILCKVRMAGQLFGCVAPDAVEILHLVPHQPLERLRC